MNSSGSLFTSDQYAYGKQLCCRNCQGNYTNNKVQMVHFENMMITIISLFNYPSDLFELSSYIFFLNEHTLRF